MIQQVLSLLEQEPFKAKELKALLIDMNEADIAEVFEELNEDLAIRVFRLLPKALAAQVFAYLEPDQQQQIVQMLSDQEIGRVINELFVDDAVDFIEEMPANVVKRILQNASEEMRLTINQVLQYPENSAGSIMTTEYIALKEDATVEQAFDYIRNTLVKKETVYNCFVISFDKLLKGVVSARTLLLAKPDQLIGDIMSKNITFTHTLTDREEVALQFKKYGLLSMPVCDMEQRLVGIVTVDDVVQVMEEEDTEDFEKLAAVKPSDQPYLKTSIFKHSRNRIVWLLVLMLSATITGAIISGYEESLAALPVLIAFVPMLMDTCGNAGCQTSTIVVRAISLNEIGNKDIFRVLFREFLVAIICGAALGAVNFVRIIFMYDFDFRLAITVTLTLMAIIVLAKGVGSLLPLLAKIIKLDPTVMAGPMLTTVLDGTSLILYFGIAKMLLNF